MSLKKECEDFWKGGFGYEYTKRNNLDLIPSVVRTWSAILGNLSSKIDSVFEFGTNSGINLDAIKLLLPEVNTNGVEINKYAYEIAVEKGHKVLNQSFYDLEVKEKFDLVFTYTVLIHVPPENLKNIYEKLYNMSGKYILICEYFSREPEDVKYRGFDNKLYKRDFASEFLENFPSLELIDYRFFWRNDNVFKEDDVTYFLFKK